MRMWNLADLDSPLHTFISADVIDHTGDLQESLVSLLQGGGGGGVHFLLRWYHSKPGARRGTDKSLLPPWTVLFTYVHTHTPTHTYTDICFCQLIITNCSSRQTLAKWPSLTGLVRQTFPLKYQTHTHRHTHTHNKSGHCVHRARFRVCLHVHILRSACSHLLPASIIVHPLMRAKEQTH